MSSFWKIDDLRYYEQKKNTYSEFNIIWKKQWIRGTIQKSSPNALEYFKDQIMLLKNDTTNVNIMENVDYSLKVNQFLDQGLSSQLLSFSLLYPICLEEMMTIA